MNKFKIFFTILITSLLVAGCYQIVSHAIFGSSSDQDSLKCLSSGIDSLSNVLEIKNVNSSLINDLKWGSLKVGSQPFKDTRIWPNHAEEWDWNKTGTRHRPGIQIADLADFIGAVDTIVLSEGVDGVLQIKPDTIEYLKKLNKNFFIARTPVAVEKYNELVSKGKRVGALIHTTC